MGFISQHDEEPYLFSVASGTALGSTQFRMNTDGFPSEGDKVKWLRCTDDYPPSECENFYLYSPTRLTYVMLI